MAQWYYLLRGRPHGPVAKEEIKREIAAGHIGARDLLYHEKDTNWREAISYPEFQALFRAEPAHESWVLLVRKTEGVGFRQRGPYSRAQVTQMLKAGEISFSDYIWRKGLKEWYKILSLSEFNESASVLNRTVAAPPSPPESASKPVMSPPSSKEPIMPEELSEMTRTLVMPEDLTAENPRSQSKEEKVIPREAEGAQKKQVKRSKRRPPKVEPIGERRGMLSFYLELAPIKKVVFLFMFVMSVVGGLFSLAYFSSFLDRKSLHLQLPKMAYIKLKNGKVQNQVPPPPPVREKVDEPKSATPPASREVKEPVTVEAKAKGTQTEESQKTVVVEEVKFMPTKVQVVKLSEGAEDMKIRVNSDGSSHFPIELIFRGEAGQVLGAKSVERYYRMNKLEDRELELKKLGLNPGTYELAVETEGVKTNLTLSLGTKDPDFKRKIKEYRKQLIFYHNNERYSLIKTAGRLEKEMDKFIQSAAQASNLSSWRGFYKNWTSQMKRIKDVNLQKITKRNSRDYVHGQKWLRLKDIRKSIDAETGRLNKLLVAGKPADLAEIKATALELRKLKEQMVQTSLWR